MNFHPEPEGRPFTVREAYQSVRNDELERQALVDSGENYAVYRDWQGMKPGDNGRFGDFYKLHPERPARTLSKMIGNVGCRGVMDWREKRRPTIAEMKRLGAYPDQFVFVGSFMDKGERIGNSVPPLFMRSIASRVRELISKGSAIRTPSPAGNYLASLEAAWADHLKPREPDAPTVISTFAGGGGSSLGYSMAGYHELLAVEWDKNAIETFHLNFPKVPFYHGDIAKLTVAECLRMAQVEPGQLDVLDGSPPCQGFSTAGKRNLDDPRNSLFKEFVRLLRGLKPKAFVMENVSGMVKGKMKLVFAEILRELKASGYNVKARLLNAMYFGVPQSRQRMIFIGIREDLQIEPSHPKGQTKPIPMKSLPNSDGADEWLSAQRCRSIQMHRSKQARKGNGFGAFFVDETRPSVTIPKVRSGCGSIYVREGEKVRYWTVDELKYAASYPSPFRFPGEARHAQERIGNSVPPLFMKSIALHVRKLLNLSADA